MRAWLGRYLLQVAQLAYCCIFKRDPVFLIVFFLFSVLRDMSVRNPKPAMRAPKTGFPVATRAPGACGTAGGHTQQGAPGAGGEQERSLPGRPLGGRRAGSPPHRITATLQWQNLDVPVPFREGRYLLACLPACLPNTNHEQRRWWRCVWPRTLQAGLVCMSPRICVSWPRGFYV